MEIVVSAPLLKELLLRGHKEISERGDSKKVPRK